MFSECLALLCPAVSDAFGKDFLPLFLELLTHQTSTYLCTMVNAVLVSHSGKGKDQQKAEYDDRFFWHFVDTDLSQKFWYKSLCVKCSLQIKVLCVIVNSFLS